MDIYDLMYYGMNSSGEGNFLLIGVIIGIILAIVLLIGIFPKSKEGTFTNKFFEKLHDYFQFKHLFIETLSKVLFLLLTCISISIGICGLFTFNDWSIPLFLVFTLLLPVLLRLVYEAAMMFILITTNVIGINNHLSEKEHVSGTEVPPASETESKSSFAEPTRTVGLISTFERGKDL